MNTLRSWATHRLLHSVHIPVMGTGFSIDSPLKIARYGISSVVSLVDDTLLEQLRRFYSQQYNLPFEEISKYEDDYRARRITAYLELLDRLVRESFETVRQTDFGLGTEITKYFDMLANSSPLKELYQSMLLTDDVNLKKELQHRLRSLMRPGEIQVNIMTKVDRANFSAKDKSPLPDEYSDALSALRGFAQSSLDSAIVFSAGFNRKLYAYIDKFQDFFANAQGAIKKRIVLKVSDYRSALIQGRFMAKKGLWVSEFRIESGLNCGGHAFASEGYLLGPILEEFKKRREELKTTLYGLFAKALQEKDLPVPPEPPVQEVTAQGGIGTANENNFLLNYYDLDGTGWGSPFLLVPEVTNVDLPTLVKLSKAKEEDLYLSEVSPLGIPFNNLRNNYSDLEKERKAGSGKPGSACPKGHLVSNTEFTEKPICTASRQYQKLKLDQLREKNLPEKEFENEYGKLTMKACICHELGEGVLLKNNVDAKPNLKRFSAVCPGPNLAYFSKIASLEEMMGHIYGRQNLLNTNNRPNLFVKELKLYLDYFKKELNTLSSNLTEKNITYLRSFATHFIEGITYYQTLFPKMLDETSEARSLALKQLNEYHQEFLHLLNFHDDIFQEPALNPASA